MNLRMIALVFALAFVLLPARARADDEFQTHYANAETLTAAEDYAGALKELAAAYQLKQPPRLLYEMARAHQKLGDGKQALELYRKYLVAEANPDPMVKADVDAQLKLLAALEPPPAPPVIIQRVESPPLERMPPFHYEVHHDRGLMAAGISLLATGYGAAVISGAIFASIGAPASGDGSDPAGNLAAAGGTLIIPVVGPLISSLVYRSTFWSVPWSLVDGAAQVAGLAMIIAGARVHKRVPVFTDRLFLSPYASAGGGGILASGRF
jgi:hypothetical protein